MNWYNPLTWVNKSPVQKILYCANPQCETPVIRGDFIAYNREEKEIYHPGECQIFAQAWKVWDTKGIVMGNFEVINRNKALRLVQEGRVQQPSLEDKVK